MERFIVAGALVFAGLVAVGPILNDGEPFAFHFSEGDSEEDHTAAASTGAAGNEQVFAADTVAIRDVAAVVTVVAEDRADVAVTISGGAGLNPVRASLSGDAVAIDGGYRRARSCHNGSDGFGVEIGGRTVPGSELPQITIKTPRDVKLSLAGAVSTTISDADEVDVSLVTCGDTRIGNVSGDLEAKLAGSGDLIVAAVTGRSVVSIAGSGGASLAKAGDVEASVAGSGSSRIDDMTGDLKAAIAGSGDLRVAAGRVGEAELSVAGSGDIRIEAPIDVLDAEVVGSGQVKVGAVRQVRGQSVLGSGEIHVDGAPPVPPVPPVPAIPPVPAKPPEAAKPI
jgi:hypothetical protein